MAEVTLKHAYALVHRVWIYEKQAPSAELVGAFNWTHAAHDYAKLALEQDKPKGVMYTVTELHDGKVIYYRKDDSSEGQA